ncbi:MAG: leucine-rich repeat protein [Tannerella sp.]|nr:leucine-rich repeat protein [Tannerella sp.]
MGKYFRFGMCVAMATMFVTATVSAQTVHNLNSQSGQMTLRSAVLDVPQEIFRAAKAARAFDINPALQSAKSVAVGDTVMLQLFESQIYKSYVSDVVTDVNGTVALTLKLPDYPMGYAIITTATEGISLVNVSIPERHEIFGSRYSKASARSYLLEIDPKSIKAPDLGNDIVEIPNQTDNPAKETSGNPQKTIETGALGVDDPAQLDLLVVYTPAAARFPRMIEAGGINNEIANRVACINLGMSNSKTGITVNLVHSAQLIFTEYLNEDDPSTWIYEPSTWINLISDSEDGVMDEVHLMRQRYNADFVQFVSAGGMEHAWMGDIDAWASAFSCVTVSDERSIVSAHELGHNLGLGHGAQQIAQRVTGIFPYSEGWRWTGDDNITYCSIQAYPGGENYADGIDAEWVPYYSNPSVLYAGQPTGDAQRADAARSLRETKHMFAAYNDHVAKQTYRTVLTLDATDITQSTATLNQYAYSKNETIVSQGFEYKQSDEESWHSSTSGKLKGLSPNTKYEFQAYVQTESGTTYGETLTFLTLKEKPDYVWEIGSPTAANVTATFNNGWLIIDGTGAMQNFIGDEYRPWHSIKDNITSVIINDGVTTIGNDAFHDCSGLTSVTIPNSMLIIGEHAFWGCPALTSLTMGNSVREFHYGSFDKCNSLTSFIIPASVDSIAGFTFAYISSLTNLTVNWQIPLSINSEVFTYTDISNVNLHVPVGSADAYKAAAVWQQFRIVADVVGNEYIESDAVGVYPNPVQDVLYIRSTQPVTKVEIYSLTGALALTEHNPSAQISVATLPKGPYIVKVITGNGMIIRKIFKR